MRAVFIERKPYCAACLWNVGSVRKHLRKVLREEVLVAAPILAVFEYAFPFPTAGRIIAFVLGALYVARNVYWLFKLPHPVVQGGDAESSILRQPVRPTSLQEIALPWWKRYERWFGLLILLWVGGIWIATGLIVWDWQHATYRQIASTLLFAAVAISFAWQQLRAGTSLDERSLVANGAFANAMVVAQSPSRTSPATITYEFYDGAGLRRTGKAIDSSDRLCEGMTTVVVYDLQNPAISMPVHSLTQYKAS